MEITNGFTTYFFFITFFLESRTKRFSRNRVCDVSGVWDRSVEASFEREIRVSDEDGENKRLKITFSLHDDISATGSRIEINQKGF